MNTMTTPNRSKRGKERPAAGARIMVGGISIAAGLGLVGAMVLTAATPPSPAGPQLVRVVVLPSGETETTVIESPPRASQPKRPQVGVPPAPQPPPVELTPAPAPPTTTSQGS